MGGNRANIPKYPMAQVGALKQKRQGRGPAAFVLKCGSEAYGKRLIDKKSAKRSGTKKIKDSGNKKSDRGE